MTNPLSTLKRKIQTLFDRGVQRMVNDSLTRQQLQIQVMNGETYSDVERWQQYGHTSVPPEGSETLVLALGGNRSNLAVICAEDKNVRLRGLKQGDSALYHLEGHFFKLTENGVIEGVAEELNITVKRVTVTATEGVDIITPTAEFSNDVIIGGDLHTKGASMTDGDSLTLGDSITDGMVSGVQGGTFKGVSSENHTHKYTDDGSTKTTQGPQ